MLELYSTRYLEHHQSHGMPPHRGSGDHIYMPKVIHPLSYANSGTTMCISRRACSDVVLIRYRNTLQLVMCTGTELTPDALDRLSAIKNKQYDGNDVHRSRLGLTDSCSGDSIFIYDATKLANSPGAIAKILAFYAANPGDPTFNHFIIELIEKGPYDHGGNDG